MEYSNEHARENPVSSLGILLASGFIVSRLMESSLVSRVSVFHENQSNFNGLS